MDTNHIAFITLSTGTKHKITQETYNQILQAEKDDFIVLPNRTTFKNSAVMEIQDINEWVDEKTFDYGQPYQQLPTGLGFEGIIKKSPNKGLELMAKGLKKFIESQTKLGIKTPNSEDLLEKMRNQYLIKNNKVLKIEG